MRCRIFFHFIIVLTIAYNQILNAQNFAPLKLGNMWVWQNGAGQIGKSIVIDTNYFINNHFYSKILIGSDTNSYYIERYRPEDSLLVEYSSSLPQINFEMPFYKLNAALGDTWSVSINGNNKAVFKIEGEYAAIVFNMPVQIKQLYVDIGGLVGRRELWTDVFGLLWGQETEGGEVFFRLTACVINGVVYGDTTTGINDKTSKTYNFNLFQNYPNPFNPSTNIDFEIKEYSLVILKVYNILGNVVADLINEKKIPGRYSVKFDGNKLSSGIYFYKLTTGGQAQVKKMILMK